MGKRQRFPHLIVQPKRPSTTKLHNTTQDASAMSTKGIADVFLFMLLSPRQKISSAVQDRLWRLLVPWPLGVFRYRLFRLYLSTDCTSMLNLPMSTHKKIRKENRACDFTSHLYRVSSPSLSLCGSPTGLLIEHDPVGAVGMGIGMNLMHHSSRIAIPGMIPSFTHIQIECFLYAQAQKRSLKL